MLTVTVDLDELAGAITGRTSPLFDEAMAGLSAQLEDVYSGARILLTGGGGFIAGQTLRVLLPLGPAKVVVADTSEHALAELVRDLRSSGSVPDSVALEPRLVDVTGPLIERVVADEGPFDVVLAFAAAKHVRSERDPVSVLHMLNVNINGTMRAVSAVRRQNPTARVFVVSTDKAADPSSIMGASKRVMEMAVLGSFPDATTTRFANVAFSSGSLLESWLLRMGRGQVLPVPAQTSRFFVSPRESGQLCALASVAPGGSIVVPDPFRVGETDLEEALSRVLGHLGLVAVPVAEAESVNVTPAPGTWPILVTQRDTAGEKGAEVFCGRDERLAAWLPALDLVHSAFDGPAALRIGDWVTDNISQPVPGPSVDDVVAQLATAVAGMRHVHGRARLDDRI